MDCMLLEVLMLNWEDCQGLVIRFKFKHYTKSLLTYVGLLALLVLRVQSFPNWLSDFNVVVNFMCMCVCACVCVCLGGGVEVGWGLKPFSRFLYKGPVSSIFEWNVYGSQMFYVKFAWVQLFEIFQNIWCCLCSGLNYLVPI